MLPLLVPNILFCLSNHQDTSLFFFLSFSLPLSVLQRRHEEGYVQANKLFKGGYCLEATSFILYLNLLLERVLPIQQIEPGNEEAKEIDLQIVTLT